MTEVGPNEPLVGKPVVPTLTVAEAEALVPTAEFLERFLFALAGVEPIDDVLAAGRADGWSAGWTVMRLQQTESLVHRHGGIPGPIAEIERGMRWCGVRPDRTDAAVEVVLRAIFHMREDQMSPRMAVRAARQTKDVNVSELKVGLSRLDSDVFDWAWDEVVDLDCFLSRSDVNRQEPDDDLTEWPPAVELIE
jgi:hypothetical protein